MYILYVYSAEPDQTPHFAASDLGLHCLTVPHKKDTRLLWVNDRQIEVFRTSF